MGTPDFAVPTLQKIINSNHVVKAVFTQKAKPKNRGKKIIPSPVEILAKLNNINIHTPETLKSENSFNIIDSIDADVIVVAAYGFIIPKNILNNKKFGSINLHPSSLPKYRGAAPLQHTILNGETETKICTMQMDEGLDTGPILLSENLNIPSRAKLKWLHDICADKGGDLIIKTLDNITQLTPQIQSQEHISYASKLSKNDSILGLAKSAIEIDNQIRAYEIWPGSYIKTNIGDIKIIEAEPIETGSNFTPGKVILDKEFIITCSDGKIKVNKIQLPGKKPISSKDFINGYKDIHINLEMKC